MTAKERDRKVNHWKKVIKKLTYNKEFLTDMERQHRSYAESRISEIREEWRKSKQLNEHIL